MRIIKNTNLTITRISSIRKNPTQDIYYQEIDQILLITKKTFYVFILVPKKYHDYTFLKINVVIKESLYSTKIKYILSIQLQDEHIFGIPQSHVDQRVATTSYN